MKRSSVALVTITGANQVIVGPSETRTTLRFWPANVTGSVWVSPVQMTGNGQGIALNSVSGLDALELQCHGDIIRHPWYAWGTVPGDTIFILEALEG
jgi:hypothetical protein